MLRTSWRPALALQVSITFWPPLAHWEPLRIWDLYSRVTCQKRLLCSGQGGGYAWLTGRAWNCKIQLDAFSYCHRLLRGSGPRVRATRDDERGLRAINQGLPVTRWKSTVSGAKHAARFGVCCLQGDALNSPSTRQQLEVGKVHCAICKKDSTPEAANDTKK